MEEISFSKSAEAGAKLLKEKLNANPKLVLVFAIDGLSTTAARQVMAELIPDRLYVQAAFAADGNYSRYDQGRRFRRSGRVSSRIGSCARRSPPRSACPRAASVPGRVEVPVEFFDSDEKSTTPQSPVYYKETRSGPNAKTGP